MKNILLVGINSKYIHPSMGIFQLYANSKYEANYHEFTIKDNLDYIIDFINSSYEKYIGFSCYIWNIEMIKKILPKLNNKIIFLGGPEASYNTSLLSEDIPYIIKGEGEESFNELMDYFFKGLALEKVSNLYYYENSNIYFTYNKLPNLNNIVHDLSLIKDFKNRICYLESSRGCYFNCSYCLASTEKPVRFFPLDEVKKNIKYLLEQNARIIKFLDRSFNINKTYTKEILSFIRDNDNGITTFQFEIVGDNFDEETISIINSLRSKMIRFEIGIQSTNPKVIEAILRKQDFNLLSKNIEAIKDKVVIHTDLIAGLPFETFASFKKSFNDTFLLFVEELQLGFLKELKGTYISKTKDEHDYIFSSNAPYEVFCNRYISHEELEEIKYVEMCVDRFYNRSEFPRLMNYLFKTLKLDPFDTFLFVGKNMTKEHPLSFYQFDILTLKLYDTLKSIVKNHEKLLYIIKKDYLTRKPIKPKIFWKQTIERNERKNVYELLVKKHNLNINDLYTYSHLEKYKNTYFLYNYKTQKEYELTI